MSYEKEAEQNNEEELELEADNFARNYLIPKNEYEIFTRNPFLSADNILRFADLQAIHPGIVVGRLQYDKHIGPNQYNQFREKYRIIQDQFHDFVNKICGQTANSHIKIHETGFFLFVGTGLT